MFSATGGILPGSINRPEMATLGTIKYDPDFLIDFESESVTGACTWNKLSYIPVVSTVSGTIRALLGLIHAIVHLACAVFISKYRSHHFAEAKLGGLNIVRGCLETVPIISNIAFLIRDSILAHKEGKKAKEYLLTHKGSRKDQIILVIQGKEIARKTLVEMDQIILKEGFTSNKRPSFWDTVRLIQSKA